MSVPGPAVFLSYVSQDAEFARRIAGALRNTGVNVWMDRGASAEGELRAQIAGCGVFMPVISANTQARLDGQFRLEWRLAGQQVRTVPDPRSFLLPIVIDATGDAEARVPAEFKTVPWTRMLDGDASPAFCARVRRLLPSPDSVAGEMAADSAATAAEEKKLAEAAARSRWRWAAVGLLLLGLLAVGGVAWWRLSAQAQSPSREVASAAAKPAAIPPAARETAREEPRSLARQAQRLIDSPDVDAGRLRRAEELCRRALALDATNPEILATASFASQALYALDYDPTPRRLALARDYAEQAVRHDANNVRAQLARASGERVAGRPAEAADLLRAVLTRVPNDPEVLRSLAQAERAAGRDAHADETLAQLRKIPGAETVTPAWETRTATKRRPHRDDPVDATQKKRAPAAAAAGEPPASAPGKRASTEATSGSPSIAANPEESPASPASKREEKSVAVLPFEHAAEDAAVSAVAEALSEEALAALAKTPGLKVSARTSAFHFKGQGVSRAEVARQLGVDYLLEGSVRRTADQLEVRAQLVKAVDGVPVWSETFARDVKEVLALPEPIGRGIAQSLRLAPAPARTKPRPAANLSAFELYLRGRQQWNLRTRESLARAEKLFEQALAIDPDFARAHVGIADVWYAQASLANRVGRRDQRGAPELARVREKVELALALDPELAEAHASLGGNVLFENWDFAGAERALRRAIALNPSYAPAYQWLAWVLIGEGRVDEALACARESVERDPLAPRILDNCGLMLGYAGMFSEQVAMQRRSLALQPDSPQARAGLVAALAPLGQFDEARAAARGLADPALRAYAEASIARSAGQPANAAELRAAFGDEPGILQAAARGLLGRDDEALGLLAAPAANVRGLAMLLFDPVFDAIRADPRFVAFLAEVGATEAHARALAWREKFPAESAPGAR